MGEGFEIKARRVRFYSFFDNKCSTQQVQRIDIEVFIYRDHSSSCKGEYWQHNTQAGIQ